MRTAIFILAVNVGSIAIQMGASEWSEEAIKLNAWIFLIFVGMDIVEFFRGRRE